MAEGGIAMKKISDPLKNTDGAALPEVIVAFLILMLIIGGFTHVLLMAGRMERRSKEMLENYQNLIGGYYLDGEADKELAVEITVCREGLLVFSGEDGGFEVPAVIRRVSNGGNDILYDVDMAAIKENNEMERKDPEEE